MSLINDDDLRKILKLKENEGQWLLTTLKHFLGIERLNQIYNEHSSLSSSSTNELSVFSASEPGFSVVSLKADSMKICCVGIKGNIICSFSRSYK